MNSFIEKLLWILGIIVAIFIFSENFRKQVYEWNGLWLILLITIIFYVVLFSFLFFIENKELNELINKYKDSESPKSLIEDIGKAEYEKKEWTIWRGFSLIIIGATGIYAVVLIPITIFAIITIFFKWVSPFY